MWVEWTEDYEHYKKGDAFELTGPSLEYYLETGKVKEASKSNVKKVEELRGEAEALTNPTETETATLQTAKKK